jgi:hypothetical protein
MIRANSLLYAIYICLIVSILCGAMLYYSNLYNQLNLHYNLREEMFLNNQSIVNYALGNKLISTEILHDDTSGIEGFYETKQYGLFTLLLTKTVLRNDTVASANIVGAFSNDKTGIHMANFGKSLNYSGKVKISGDNYLPNKFIEPTYINNERNDLSVKGKIDISEIILPNINPEFKKVFENIDGQKTAVSELEKQKDSLFFNSFYNKTKDVYVSSILSNVIFKGNFILRSKDSIRVRKSVVLEDVILIAPKISFEEGFTGTVQAFSTNGIDLEEEVILNYPSILCLYSENIPESKIRIKKECKITGAVVLFGNTIETIDKHTVEMQEHGLIFGDVYCTGKLFLKSTVYGSVYTNKFFYQTASSTYENLVKDIEINALKRPPYFVAVPLFEAKKTQYSILKKVL